MRKTTKACKQAVESFDNFRNHWETVIRVKNELPLENQQEWVKDTSIDTIIGRIEGYRTAVETLLHESRCYHGFCYVDSEGELLEHITGQYIHNNPEYRDYRVSFSVRG